MDARARCPLSVPGPHHLQAANCRPEKHDARCLRCKQNRFPQHRRQANEAQAAQVLQLGVHWFTLEGSRLRAVGLQIWIAYAGLRPLGITERTFSTFRQNIARLSTFSQASVWPECQLICMGLWVCQCSNKSTVDCFFSGFKLPCSFKVFLVSPAF